VWVEAKVGEGATFYFSVSKGLGREDVAGASADLTFGELAIAKSGA
jgi:hypothetical protein